MKLPDDQTIVMTPQEDASDYAPDWRYQLAKCYATNPLWILPEPWGSDVVIVKTREYLTARAARQEGVRRGVITSDLGLQMYERAIRWRDDNTRGSTRLRLEALLLTEASYDVIAADVLGEYGSAECCAIYEKLFFNVRDHSGRLTKSVVRLLRFIPDMYEVKPESPMDSATLWKVLALRGGYSGLMNYWTVMQGSGEVDRQNYLRGPLVGVIQAKSAGKILHDKMGSYDQINLLGTLLTSLHQELVRKGEVGQDTDKIREILLTLLYQFRPDIITAAVNDPEKQRALESTREVSRDIVAQAVIDKGPEAGYAAMMQVIDSGIGRLAEHEMDAARSRIAEHKKSIESSKEQV